MPSFKHLSQLKPYSPYIVGLFVLVAVLCSVGYCFHRGYFSHLQQGFENQSDKFVMYYADWCPHCHTAKPELEALGSTQTIGGKKIQILKVEEKDIPEAIKPTISGYPTIQLQNADGSLKADYSGERTTAGFLQFLKQQYQG